MEKNTMAKTGKTATTAEKLEHVLFNAQCAQHRALDMKRAGDMDGYYNEIAYYLGIRNALEMLGLVIYEDYDFNDLED